MPQAAMVTSPVAHGMSGFGAFMAAIALAATAMAQMATSMLQGMVGGTGLLAGPGGLMPALPPMGGGDSIVCLGSLNVLWNSLNAARVGDITDHGDAIAAGSLSVLVNSRPAARIGDPTVQGGIIIGGSRNVFIGGGTSAGAGVPPVNPQCGALAKARDMALLADHTYDDNKPLPPGYRYLNPNTPEGQQALAQLNLTKDQLEPDNSSFRAQVFARDGANGTHYVVGYRGTQTAEDWKNNFQQGAGADSDQYQRAMLVARRVNKASDGNVEFIGHSLGGGEASAASVITGRPATTYNAAGLSAQTVGGSYPATPTPVDAYYTQGEPLSALQDHRAEVLGGLTGAAGAANPYAGAGLGGFILGREASGRPMLPQAYGTRHPLPRVAPPGAGFLQRNNVVAWHGMDYIMRGLEAQCAALGCP